MSRAAATITAFNEARALFKPLARGPCPTDLYERVRWDMAGAHVVITETLSNIYMKIDSILPAEQEKFAHFSLFGVQFLTHHHWLEETMLFPALEPEFTCPAVAEHATFSEAMHNLEHYLEDVCGLEKQEKNHDVAAQGKQKVAFDAAKIKGLIEKLCEPMFIHLKAEIGYLDPAKVRATGLPVEKLENMNAAIEKHLQNEVDPFSYLVHGCLHVPPAIAQFPPIPHIVRRLLVPWVFYWKHRSLWKYAPNYTADD